MQRLVNPYPLFLDLRGALLDAGYVYIGEPGTDPEVAPITVYFDVDATIPADQPLRTRGAFIVNGMSPAFIWIEDDDYSIRVRDADGNEVYYASSIAAAGAAAVVDYQPLSDTLTLLAELTTTAFGRSLLTTSNSTSARALLGIVASLPSAGGTVTGNIVRSGAGSHLYHNDPALTSGRFFITANGAADPTSLPGDVWIELAP